MSNVHYNVCDRCGAFDDAASSIYHFLVTDVNAAAAGHLCIRCARECLPNAEWARDDRSA